MFYSRQEQGARCTVWFSMNGFAAIGGGLLSYGIGHTHTAVEQWQLVGSSFLVNSTASHPQTTYRGPSEKPSPPKPSQRLIPNG